MKTVVLSVGAFLFFLAASAHAASDADVTIIKADTVVIEEDVITIVAEARTQITLINDNDRSTNKGPQWMGRSATRVEVKSDKATFRIKNPRDKGLEKAWQASLQAARDLKEGKKVGRIGYYSPDISIKGNLIVSITGNGYFYQNRP
ncbi:MAG: hypothetical protein JWO08_1091 [Verrucomicrobiaceae bacterium]|nr:hypothetical protein [Verrucomicrobiaceae bacterium]